MWVIDAPDNIGASPRASKQILANRRLTRTALAAANIGMQFVGVMPRTGFAVHVVYVAGQPRCLRMGAAVATERPLRSISPGVTLPLEPFELDWITDLPLRAA
jgi:hypothetical protein